MGVADTIKKLFGRNKVTNEGGANQPASEAGGEGVVSNQEVEAKTPAPLTEAGRVEGQVTQTNTEVQNPPQKVETTIPSAVESDTPQVSPTPEGPQNSPES